MANPITGLFDLLMAPFGGHADLALTTMSVLCGVATIFVFRATSNPAGIRRTRGLLVAHVLEMRIYQDDLRIILSALAGALATNLRYLRQVAWPLLLIGVLVGTVCVQLDARFAHAPLRVRDAALVTVTCRPGLDVTSAQVSLDAGEGASVEPGRVRVPARRQVIWRVRAESPGTPAVTVHVGEVSYRFVLAAEAGTRVVGSQRSRSTPSALLHPGLPRLPGDAPIDRVDVRYPPARHWLFGWRAHWLAVFATWSLVGALIPKLFFHIEV